MIPYDQLTHAMSMPKNLKCYTDSKWFKIRKWIADKIPYSVSMPYNSCDWLHPTRIYDNLCRIATYAPLLWNDRDWDQTHLYKMMAFKLEMMEKNHRENRVIADWKKVASEIKIAKNALKRIIEDDYAKKSYSAHYKRYPHKLKNMDKWEKTPEGHLIMPSMCEDERVSFHRCCDMEEALRRSDLELFCKMFMDYSRGWWD